MQDLVNQIKQHIEWPLGLVSGVVSIVAQLNIWEASFNAFVITIVTFFAKKSAEWLHKTFKNFFE